MSATPSAASTEVVRDLTPSPGTESPDGHGTSPLVPVGGNEATPGHAEARNPSRRLSDCLNALRAAGRTGLSAYLPFGYPDLAASTAAFAAAVAGGADWLELGIAFSDPAADGPTIQAATAQALAKGATVAGALGQAKKLRDDHPDLPIVAMTYANLPHRHGWDAFCADAARHGIDGLIVPDVPLEESAPLRQACRRHGLAWVALVTPTTPDDRMHSIAATCTGFLYVVANVGVTGQADPGTRMADTVRRARAAAPGLPMAVGFGVRSAADVHRIRAAGADAVIVGSHLVQVLANAGAEGLRTEVAKLRQATT